MLTKTVQVAREMGPRELLESTRPLPEARCAQERLDDALNLLKGWLWEMDADLRFSYLSESVRTYASRAPEWHYGKTRAEVGSIDPDSAQWRDHFRQLQLHQPFDPFEFRRHQGGRWFWMRTIGRPVFHSNGDFCGYRGIAFDVTAEKEAREALADTKRFLDTVIENAPVAMIVKEPITRRILLVNQAYEQLIGVPREQVVGKTAFQIFRKDTAELFDKYDEEALRSEDKIVTRDIVVETPAHGVRVTTATRMIVRDESGKPKYLIISVEDITERKRSEERMTFLANHDALTGLANRGRFMEKLEEARARQRRWGEQFNLLLLDLNRFKAVNDALGHPAGDALLKQLAERIGSSIRETDTVARIGGDEFAIIQAGMTSHWHAAEALARKLIALIDKPFDIQNRGVNVGVSIGITAAPELTLSHDSVLKMADVALYRAKSSRRSAFCFSESQDHSEDAPSAGGLLASSDLADQAGRSPSIELPFQDKEAARL